MWNHKLKYKGIGGTRYNNQVAPTTGGAYQLVKLREEILGLYYKEGVTIEDTNNILLYFFQEVESPARLAGNILLVHETLNQIAQPRQAWIYNPGQRRVRRAPNVAYDNPGTASDGLRTNDMTDMFNGAMDRFDWEVVGKKEMYVPYNSYDAHTGDVTTDDLVMSGHLNPEYMRYELHRVWIVDARLKEGTRHINSRRTFYMDEDSYQILLIDHYDQRGELWRASEAHSINYYDVPTFWTTIESHMDLLSGRYVAVGLDNQDPVNTFNVELARATTRRRRCVTADAVDRFGARQVPDQPTGPASGPVVSSGLRSNAMRRSKHSTHFLRPIALGAHRDAVSTIPPRMRLSSRSPQFRHLWPIRA